MGVPNNTTTPQLGYTQNSGTSSSNPFVTFYAITDPTPHDINFPIQKRWVNFSTTPIREWILESFTSANQQTTANWVQITGGGSGTLVHFNVPLGTTPVIPDGTGGVTLTSTGGTVAITGGTNTINLDIVGDEPAIEQITVQAGTTTIVPTAGVIAVSGAVSAAGSTPVQTFGTASNAYETQVQLSQATASTSASKVGLSAFNSSQFNVDANGFVSLIGSGLPTVKSTKLQVFTTSGTYTPTSGMLYCWVRMLGGGGAGGGAVSTGGSQFSVGGGGGCGQYAEAIFSASTIGASQTITIGAGGTGVSGMAGGNGGTTSLGTLMTATAGAGGSLSAAGSSAVIQGASGIATGTGAQFSSIGQQGGFGFANSTFTLSGQGGQSAFGSGGGALVQTTGNGNPATGFGSGGSGALNTASSSAATGGNGVGGFVLIMEFID